MCLEAIIQEGEFPAARKKKNQKSQISAGYVLLWEIHEHYPNPKQPA